ncbi:MAG: EVE domain-containing protein [Pirellulaceae bacterium]|nr:EVE domain-containing protein [Pirellulaceae bacterium]
MKKSFTARPNAYWLMKTEPNSFSIQDLAKAKHRTTCWDGVRNYQARNYMRDSMRIGDRVLVYHSNADPSCIVGTAIIAKTAYPDPTAWDSEDPHFDPKSDPKQPRWFMVDIQLESIFETPLALAQLRTIPELSKMELLRKGSRLSIQTVRPEEFKKILTLGKSKNVK